MGGYVKRSCARAALYTPFSNTAALWVVTRGDLAHWVAAACERRSAFSQCSDVAVLTRGERCQRSAVWACLPLA